ncbi:MAG TPA: phosphogluconate dehydrogenase C-terminal domain-containing protein [Acidobacteriota bacterium]|nr:phosphogluconate dehydrogenase C-terminal domain-containing protein [Acidobacteriota bacterium]
MITVAVFGAAGSMGTRAINRLSIEPDEYKVLPVEGTEAGLSQLRLRGLEPCDPKEAAKQADAVILAVPDVFIEQVAAELVPRLASGAMVICLDPAAPYAGKIKMREDISYFVTHPAHPPVFNEETDWEARRDFFGSGLAKQAIVSALMQGPESDYEKGEKIAIQMFGPVLRSHRVTVHQMALLEPVLSETVAATCLSVIREALDETVRRGVPETAARDFLMGHINIELAILFDEIDWDFSEGAQKAIADAKKSLFQPDWKKVFEEDKLRESTRRITGSA